MKIPSIEAIRDTTLFVLAVAGLVYEVFQGSQANITLVTGFFGILGLPLFIRNDERRKARSDKDE
jgi:hypothetical protein